MRERFTIGFGFGSDWLRKWREIFKPITKRSNAKPKQTRITFDTQVKTALSSYGTRGKLGEHERSAGVKHLLEISLRLVILIYHNRPSSSCLLPLLQNKSSSNTTTRFDTEAKDNSD